MNKKSNSVEFKPGDHIRRAKHESNYTIILNSTIQDNRLTWKARGLHCYILSLPDTWEINIEHLSNQSDKDGKDVVKSALKELQAYGYIEKSQARDDKNRFTKTVWTVYEAPQVDFPLPEAESPKVDFPSTGRPQMDKPLTVNPSLVISNKEINNSKINEVEINTPLTPQGEFVEVEVPFSDWEDENPEQENLELLEPTPLSQEIQETSALARNSSGVQISPPPKKSKSPTKDDIAQCFEAFRLRYNELMGDMWSRCDKATPDRLKNFTRTWAEHGQELFESLEYASVYLHQAEWARKERRSIDTILWSGRLTKYAESGKSGNATKSANDRAEEIMARTYARAMALENPTRKVEALAS